SSCAGSPTSARSARAISRVPATMRLHCWATGAKRGGRMPAGEESGPSLPEGAFDGRRAFVAHVHAAFTAAARQNWREIGGSAVGFAAWPLGERALSEALQAWCAAGRSFVMLAQRFDFFEREHARFVTWRRMWSHIIDCRACNGPGLPPVPSAIWTPAWFM